MALTKINASVIANNTIAVGNIADNSVDATKIASNSILTRHIDDAQITTDQILDGTIATADIADDAVTADKLANAINTSIAAKLPLAGGTMTGALAGTAATFSGNIQSASFSAGSSDSASELLYLLGSGHTGHGASNTVSLASIGESTSGNTMGLWFGSMTNENTGVIGTRTATGNLAFQTHSGGWGERMRITYDGKVGIGTSSPTAILDVVGPAARPTSLAEVDTGSTARFRSDSSNADSLYIAEAASGALIQVNDGATNSTTVKPLALQPFGGNVGIGTTSPNSYSGYTALTINGTSGGLLDFETDGTFVGEVYANGTSGLGIQAIGSRTIVFRTDSGDRMTVDNSGANARVGIGVAPTHNFNLQGTGTVEARFRSSDGDTSLQISSDADETHDSELNFMSGTSGRGSIVYDHNTTANQQKMIFKTGDLGVDAMTIRGDGLVGIGTVSVPINESGGTQPLYLTMHRDAGNLIELSADHAASGELIGGIDFTNDNNADATNNDADGKLVALMRARSYTDDSNASDDSGGILQFATKEHGNVLAERLKINQTGEVQIKGQYNSSGNSQFAFKTVFYQFDMDSGGTHYLQVPLYSSYSSSNSSGWAEMDIAWFPDHASHTHLHSYKFMWGSNHTRVLNLGVISATANETSSSYGPYNITSKSELFRHPTAGENNMTYLYIKMQGYHAVNKRRVITLRGVASAGDVASIGPVIDHGSTVPVSGMVSVNAEIESA